MPPESRPLALYFPDVLRDVREFQALADAEEPEIGELWRCMGHALNDQFIKSLTEYGARRWEKILKITPGPAATLAERKDTIWARLLEKLPFTIRMLHIMLDDLCGKGNFVIELDAGKYELRVLLGSVGDNNARNVHVLLRRICPANMVCKLAHYAALTAKIHYAGAMLQTATYTLKSSETIHI